MPVLWGFVPGSNSFPTLARDLTTSLAGKTHSLPTVEPIIPAPMTPIFIYACPSPSLA